MNEDDPESFVYVKKQQWPHHKQMREWVAESGIHACPMREIPLRGPNHRLWIVPDADERVLFILRWVHD